MSFERGFILYQQDRYDLAEREFRKDLAGDPENSISHAFLASCLNRMDRHAEALREVDEAIRLDPESPFSHSVRSAVLVDLKKYEDAERSALEAIRLDPGVSGYRAQLSSTLFMRNRWNDALKAADEGLALDPEDVSCVNLRAMSLVKLGRDAEAAKSLGSALAEAPENSWTHANQGWAYLHRNNPRLALDHFREALRLDPENDYARAGIVEALKARHFIYRQMLRFFLWMGKQSKIGQWAVVLALIFGRQILNGLAERFPALAPAVLPLAVALFGFMVMTWIASPLFNGLLLFNRFGRLSLRPAERWEALLVGGAFSISVGLLASVFITGSGLAILYMAYFGLMIFPLRVAFISEPGLPRLITGAIVIGLGGLGAYCLAALTIDPKGVQPWSSDAAEHFGTFVNGAFLSTWIPFVFARRFSG